MSTAPQRPTARLFVLCAEAALNAPSSGDLLEGWWELSNLYHTVYMPPGVSSHFQVARFYAYAQLTDGLGDYQIGISIIEADLANPGRDRVVGHSDPEPALSFTNPWEVHEVAFTFRDIPFIRPGQYRFELRENGRPLEGGISFLRVMSGVE